MPVRGIYAVVGHADISGIFPAGALVVQGLQLDFEFGVRILALPFLLDMGKQFLDGVESVELGHPVADLASLGAIYDCHDGFSFQVQLGTW